MSIPSAQKAEVLIMSEQEKIAKAWNNQKRRERYRNNPAREKRNRLHSYVNVLMREGVLIPLETVDDRGNKIPRQSGGHDMYILKEGALS